MIHNHEVPSSILGPATIQEFSNSIIYFSGAYLRRFFRFITPLFFSSVTIEGITILQHSGITRSVVWLNPTTGEPEVRPIYEVMSSHSARRAFSGNMYDKVQDPNLICAFTGHKEGSKSFARYRKIDEDANRKTISLLE